MPRLFAPRLAFFFSLTLATAGPAKGSDWTNLGGNALRNGLSTAEGPSSPDVAWSAQEPDRLFGPPVVAGGLVFTVRAMWPANDTRIVCQRLDSGATVWNRDFSPWRVVVGVAHGHLFLADNDRMFALDPLTGLDLWTSISLGRVASDAVVAANGDLVFTTMSSVVCLRGQDGTLLWSCPSLVPWPGCAVNGNAAYGLELDSTSTSFRVFKRDLATGALLAESPLLDGSVDSENAMVVAPDGTILVPIATDLPVANTGRLHALRDDGSPVLGEIWSVPNAAVDHAQIAVGPDGSLYHFAAFNEVHRIDVATGATIDSTGPLQQDYFDSGILAVDRIGRVFLTSDGYGVAFHLYSFDADLTLRWIQGFPLHDSCGGIAIAGDGDLLISSNKDVQDHSPSELRVYRTRPTTYCFGDGAGTTCPCGSGGLGRGCPNSIHPLGAQLLCTGTARISADSLALVATGMPSSTVMYVQGDERVNDGRGTVFGDGLRCAGGVVVRLNTTANVAGASQYPSLGDPPISIRGLIPPSGGLRTYQCLYRDAHPTFCTSATFNLTNGVQVTWTP